MAERPNKGGPSLVELICLASSKVFKSIAFRESRVAHFVRRSTAVVLYDVARGTLLDGWWAGFLGIATPVALDFTSGKGLWVTDAQAAIKRLNATEDLDFHRPSFRSVSSFIL